MIPEERQGDIAKLRDRMGGEGDVLSDETIHAAWDEFSTAFDASWLIVSDSTFGNFTGYLLRQHYKEQSE